MRDRAGWTGLAAGGAAVGWAVATLLGDLAPCSPAWGAVVAGGIALLSGRLAAPGLGSVFLPCWLGLAALPLPRVRDRLAARLGDASFERVGLIWTGAWRHADPATYLSLLPAGALIGLVAGWILFRARRDPAAVAVLGMLALAVAALWRTMLHPPSGDEPALLFAARQWLLTGSAELTAPWDASAAEWSRAVEFRDTLVHDHAIGAMGGPQYTYHGIVLPEIYGLLSWPYGRVGLALALVVIAGWAVRSILRTAAVVTGRPVSGRLAALVCCGSPLAVYTVFMGPDLPAAALMAAGVGGLATGRVAPVALAAVALPWLHQKCVFLSAGLVLGALVVSRRHFAIALGAFLLSFVPEAIWISGKIGVPVWPPTAIFAKHAQYGAAWSPAVWLQSVPGLLVDRYAGLVWYPAWIAALGGCVVLARRGTSAARAVLAAGIPYLLALLSFNMWSGGNGAPGRQLVPLLPLLVIGAAVLDARLTGARRTVWRALAGLAVAHALVLLFLPPLAFESAKSKIESVLTGRLGFDPLALLPAVSKLGSGDLPGAAVWMWLAVLAGGTAWLVRRLPTRVG